MFCLNLNLTVQSQNCEKYSVVYKVVMPLAIAPQWPKNTCETLNNNWVLSQCPMRNESRHGLLAYGLQETGLWLELSSHLKFWLIMDVHPYVCFDRAWFHSELGLRNSDFGKTESVSVPYHVDWYLGHSVISCFGQSRDTRGRFQVVSVATVPMFSSFISYLIIYAPVSVQNFSLLFSVTNQI